MSQSFFYNLIGETIHFINPQGRRNSCTVTPAGAVELYKLQDHGYKFLPAIHTSEAVCVACEG